MIFHSYVKVYQRVNPNLGRFHFKKSWVELHPPISAHPRASDFPTFLALLKGSQKKNLLPIASLVMVHFRIFFLPKIHLLAQASCVESEGFRHMAQPRPWYPPSGSNCVRPSQRSRRDSNGSRSLGFNSWAAGSLRSPRPLSRRVSWLFLGFMGDTPNYGYFHLFDHVTLW